MVYGTGMVSAKRSDFVKLHVYGHGIMKLVHFKRAIRRAGYELSEKNKEKIRNAIAEGKKKAKAARDAGEGKFEKTKDNLARTKADLLTTALCNRFDYFCTFTQDKLLRDRYDVKAFKRGFRDFIVRENQKRKRKLKVESANLSYVLIFEKHDDGAWHAHGIICGLQDYEMRDFEPSQTLPDYIRGKLEQGKDVKAWKAYEKQFGYCLIEPIVSPVKTARYMVKYVTKDALRNVKEYGERIFVASVGLAKAKKYTGTLIHDMSLPVSFKNEYCAVWDIETVGALETVNNYIVWDNASSN